MKRGPHCKQQITLKHDNSMPLSSGQMIDTLQICNFFPFISLCHHMAYILNISRDVLKRKQWTYFSFQRPGLPPYSGSGWLLPFQESLSPHSRHSEQQKWKFRKRKKMYERKLLFTSMLCLPPSILTISVAPWSEGSLPQGISWNRNENMDSMHSWNLLPEQKMEEKREDLLEGQRRVPILWRTRLRLRPPKCLQWPRCNQLW